jgi:hypothetical protein
MFNIGIWSEKPSLLKRLQSTEAYLKSLTDYACRHERIPSPRQCPYSGLISEFSCGLSSVALAQRYG